MADDEFESDATPSMPQRTPSIMTHRRPANTPRESVAVSDAVPSSGGGGDEFSFPISRTRSADIHEIPLKTRQRIEECYDLLKQGRYFDAESYSREGILHLLAKYVRGSSGWTFLHQAAYHNDPDIVMELIKHGADKSIRGRFDGKTPYDVALEHTSSSPGAHHRCLDLLEVRNEKERAPVRGPRGSDF